MKSSVLPLQCWLGFPRVGCAGRRHVKVEELFL